MELSWEGMQQNPGFKIAIKYGSIGMVILDFLKTLADLPETLRKDSGLIVVAGHVLWHLIKFPAECYLLMLAVYIVLGLAIGVASFGFLSPSKNENVSGVIAIISFVTAICLEIAYGFYGTFALVGSIFASHFHHS